MANNGMDVDEEYENIIQRDSSWRERKNEIKAGLLGERPGTEDEIGDRINRAIETEADHDQLLQSTISVFDPRGKVGRETGWRILVTEPLEEQNLPNPDALIGNLEQNWAILVECKTGLSSPGNALTDLYEAADAVREHREYLTEKTGLEISNIDCVLCVPSHIDFEAAEAVARHEREELAEEQVYIWRLHRFRGETLQLYDQVETREGSEALHDHELAQFLSGEGVQVSGGSETTPEYFPSSHLANIIEVAFADILFHRKREDEPLTTFTRGELRNFLTSEDNLLHYAADTIGERLCNEILDRLLGHDLIEPRDKEDALEDIDVFEYSVEGRTLETLQANLTEGYVEAEIDEAAETKARKQTIEEFRDEHGSFDSFGS